MNFKNKITTILLGGFLASNGASYAQISSQELAGKQINTITTAVPFLLITPDSRSGAMGDVGVAISPDANSIHWNPSKLAFIKNDAGFSMSYSPWLRQLVNDINLAYVTGYKKIDDMSAVSASLRYFSLGNITFTDQTGGTIREFNPNEFAFDVAYARKMSENISMGLALRYINSNLTGGTAVGGAATNAGQSIAADVSGYYESNKFDVSGKDATLAIGLNISNIGSKMSYSNSTDNKDFIPTNLRLGTAFNMDIDEFNKFTIAVDANKLLVPTNPVYKTDENGQIVIDANTNNPVIAHGRDNNTGVASGIFGSFSDAPGIVTTDENGQTTGVVKGSKFKEELSEVNLSVGAEYFYNNVFALRAGYFYEAPTKGNRQFVSFGAGIKYQVFQLDLSYLVALTQQSPIANTIRFSLLFNFGEKG